MAAEEGDTSVVDQGAGDNRTKVLYRLTSTDDEFKDPSQRYKSCPAICVRRWSRLEKILAILTVILLLISVIVLALLLAEKKRQTTVACDKDPEEVCDAKTIQVCQYSEEAKRVGLPEFLNKVQNEYYRYNADTLDLSVRSPNLVYFVDFKDRYRPANMTPEYLKEKTDAAFALYDEIKNKDINEDKMSPREIKGILQVKLFLRSTFGQPYSQNFYDGDWLLGPNHFCLQPLCYLGDGLGKYSVFAKPTNLSELQDVLKRIRLHGETIHQIKANTKMGVSIGMVRSIFTCHSGLDAVKQQFKKLSKENNPNDILNERFVSVLRNKTFLSGLPKHALEYWRKSKGRNASQSIDEALTEGLGKPLVELLDYLENEHVRHCLPEDVSSGMAGLPVDYVYLDGKRTKERTTKILPITGTLLSGKTTYKNTLPYFTTSDKTPDEINKIGEQMLKILYPQVVEIALNVTGEKDEALAIREFKKILNSSKQNFNAEPFPANESDVAAHKNCSDEASAKANCPKRWAAMEKWSYYCHATMSKLSSTLIPFFYHTGAKITVPNCPIQMSLDFNPSAAGQSFRRSDPSCSTPTYYNLPFFLDNYGPKYSEWTITAHEAWPGHHTQVQGMVQYFRDRCSDVVKWVDSETSNTFFVEGWALYAEYPVMAVDADIYMGAPLQRYGMLRWQIWRALRLIVDTGLHYRGMNRTTARHMFGKYAWDETDLTEKEVTRYQGAPGQATAYMLGQQKIMHLRRHCEAKLGDDFNIKDFHYQILSQGTAPESLLDRHIKKYVNCSLGIHEDDQCDQILNPKPVRLRAMHQGFEERSRMIYYL